jgi:squalene-hopene/tetraprenyl-beta-curcumene cyclase
MAPLPASLVFLILLPCALAQDSKPAAAGSQPAFAAFQQKGVDYLLGKQQKDGWFVLEMRGREMKVVGAHALAVTALMTKPAALRTDAEKKAIEQGVGVLAAAQNADGSFGTEQPNYMTCAAVQALAAADKEKYAPQLQKAQKFLLSRQLIDGLGFQASDPNHGGFGYGGSERADLSNTQMTLDALTTTGLAKDHEAWQKALVFLTRSQNHRATNDFVTEVKSDKGTAKMVSGDDGGAFYYPGNSSAGYDTLPDGARIARSYGSMTYALLKAYILCGLPATDARMVAARQWIEKNYSVDENPGAAADQGEKGKYQGLFYYYLTMGRTLSLMGLKTVKDGKGAERNWKQDLAEALRKLQLPDGSWINQRHNRWWEDMPILATAFALIALQ